MSQKRKIYNMAEYIKKKPDFTGALAQYTYGSGATEA